MVLCWILDKYFIECKFYVKYDLASDLHVDINQGRLPEIDWATYRNEGSHLIVIAGDSCNNFEGLINELDKLRRVYSAVVFVDGNHEHYDSLMSVKNNMEFLEELADMNEGLYYLRGNNSVQFEDVLFVGACSWYDFRFIPDQYTLDQARESWLKQSSDRTYIHFDKSPEHYALEQSLAIADMVEAAQDNDDIKKIVVVTHTVPVMKGITIKGEMDWDTLNGAYGNKHMDRVWEKDVEKKIIHSVFGHTHFDMDFMDKDGIRFVVNPLGYHGYDGDRSRWGAIQLDTDDERGVLKSAFGEVVAD